MTHAVDVRRRERVAVRQPPEDPALLHGLEQAMAELLNSLGVMSDRLAPAFRRTTGTNTHRFWSAYDAAHAALNAYREGKR